MRRRTVMVGGHSTTKAVSITPHRYWRSYVTDQNALGTPQASLTDDVQQDKDSWSGKTHNNDVNNSN